MNRNTQTVFLSFLIVCVLFLQKHTISTLEEEFKKKANLLKMSNQTLSTLLENIYESQEATTDVFDEIYNVLRNTKARKALLLRADNFGKGGAVYSSVVYEAHDRDVEPIKNQWKNQKLDLQYLEMLEELKERGRIVNIVDQMEPSLLKDVYLKKKVSHSVVYSIADRGRSFYYMSVTYGSKQGMNEKLLYTDSQAQILRDIFFRKKEKMKAFSQ